MLKESVDGNTKHCKDDNSVKSDAAYILIPC